jgi:hypothetical protein
MMAMMAAQQQQQQTQTGPIPPGSPMKQFPPEFLAQQVCHLL